MKKIFLLMLLICAVMVNGCDFGKKEPVPVNPPKQEVKQQSFIVYRAAADGREKLLPEKFTINDNGKPIAENALIALVSTKPQDASMEDVVPIGTKVLCYAITNTLTEFPEIKRVQILIEGKKVTTISGHMDVEEPMIRNKDFL